MKLKPQKNSGLNRILVLFTTYGYITYSQCDQLPVGQIARLIEHCTGIAEVMGLNPSHLDLIFFQLLISQLPKLCITALLKIFFFISRLKFQVCGINVWICFLSRITKSSKALIKGSNLRSVKIEHKRFIVKQGL